MIKIQGRLQYFKNWCVAWLPHDFGNYYYSLIPKAKCAQRQMYAAHITVVRKGIERVPNMDAWNKYDGKNVDIYYDLPIVSNGIYFWLDAYSEDIEDIRVELGMPRIREPFDCFHITVGNLKLEKGLV